MANALKIKNHPKNTEIYQSEDGDLLIPIKAVPGGLRWTRQYLATMIENPNTEESVKKVALHYLCEMATCELKSRTIGLAGRKFKKSGRDKNKKELEAAAKTGIHRAERDIKSGTPLENQIEDRIKHYDSNSEIEKVSRQLETVLEEQKQWT